MSAVSANTIPTLKSLIQHADTLLKSLLNANVQLLQTSAYFDEAAKVQYLLQAYYPSTLKEPFLADFISIVDGKVSQKNFHNYWEPSLEIKISRLPATTGGHYSVALFTLVLTPVPANETVPDSPGTISTLVSILDDELITPEVAQPRAPSLNGPSMVSFDNSPHSFIEKFAKKQGILKDAMDIGEKITDLYHQPFNKADLCYGETFYAYCSGTPSHAVHTHPAHSAKDDDHLNTIDELINLDPYGTKSPTEIPADPHTEEVVSNTKSYVGVNFKQFSFCGYESITSLVKTKAAFYHCLKSNTCELYLQLKLRHVLVQHYCLVMAKLDAAHIQEEAKGDTSVVGGDNLLLALACSGLALETSDHLVYNTRVILGLTA
ncbi:uncharacterized protein BT62DRAFT_919046 [Guyanagaster necrorhizus]|uniref:Uncharacterized protein n=1 Tax=Guyanagaster necrorhizus TaxID=856835 RepID=A0A9P8AUB4_9AGAR|nr:uncharacterized protein BT62DRAFT_919046 [Guyanagaster necrorhizus MCA 3950]KAG7447861.1 hypothetical protein BT62DRAFT_919046 [Guyanagaster necrorhizus MCA 3950]